MNNNINTEMVGDNSDMVDDILNELNNQGDTMDPNMNQNMDPNMDPNMNQRMPPVMDPNMTQNMNQRMPPVMDNRGMRTQIPPGMNNTDVQSILLNERGFNKDINNQLNKENINLNIQDKKVSVNNGLQNILAMLKNPLLITTIIYILFNPFTKTLLAKYLPKLFSVNTSLIRRHISVILLSLIVSIIYVILTMFL